MGESKPNEETSIPKPVQHTALQKDPQKKCTWKTISVIGTIFAAIIGGGIYAATRNLIQDTPMEIRPNLAKGNTVKDTSIDFLNQLKLEDANPFYEPICENGLISNYGKPFKFDERTNLDENLVEEVELVDEIFNDALSTNGEIILENPLGQINLREVTPYLDAFLKQLKADYELNIDSESLNIQNIRKPVELFIKGFDSDTPFVPSKEKKVLLKKFKEIIF